MYFITGSIHLFWNKILIAAVKKRQIKVNIRAVQDFPRKKINFYVLQNTRLLGVRALNYLIINSLSKFQVASLAGNAEFWPRS